MATRSAREAMYHQLTEVLGHGPAETLMSYLPDERPATKGDVTELRQEIRDVRSGLHTDVETSRSDLHAEIEAMRTGFHAELREFRAEVREDLRHIQGLLAAQTRTHVAASLGSAVTVAGLVFIAAQIV